MGMEAWVNADPQLLKLSMLNFVTTLVNRAADVLPTVGRPLTRLTMSSDDKVDWVEIGACANQPKKGDSIPNDRKQK